MVFSHLVCDVSLEQELNVFFDHMSYGDGTRSRQIVAPAHVSHCPLCGPWWHIVPKLDLASFYIWVSTLTTPCDWGDREIAPLPREIAKDASLKYRLSVLFCSTTPSWHEPFAFHAAVAHLITIASTALKVDRIGRRRTTERSSPMFFHARAFPGMAPLARLRILHRSMPPIHTCRRVHKRF